MTWFQLWICHTYLPASEQKALNLALWAAHARATGRKLARLRMASSQETVWKTVVTGRTVESLPVLQEAITQMERLLGLDREDKQIQARRTRTEIREGRVPGTVKR